MSVCSEEGVVSHIQNIGHAGDATGDARDTKARFIRFSGISRNVSSMPEILDV